MATAPGAEWLDRFREHDVPAAPVLEHGRVADEPQVAARGLFGNGRPLTPLPWHAGERLPAAPELDADSQKVFEDLSM
jgi:crotonobetainyl-CoA:carnitine CoA-transferase CaiB-like acyl-CoA transferase